MQTQTLPSYLPDDHELVKVTQDDGKIVFKHPVGSEIETDNIDLYSFIHQWIGKCRVLVDLLNDEDYSDFGCILELILQNAEHELEEVFSFVDASIGHIRIDTVTRGSFPYRTGRVVALSLREPKEGGVS